MEANQASNRPLGIRTRSGRVINAYLLSSQPDRKRPRPIDSSDLNSPVKDLRVKRVFSQTFKSINDTKSDSVLCSAEPDQSSPEAKIDPTESFGNAIDYSTPDLDDSKSEEPERLGLGFLTKSPNSGSQPESSQTSQPEVKANRVELQIGNQSESVFKSRKRVFQAPGSFSYRRMLPYLKDITKDNSWVLDLCELPKRGKGLEGNSFRSKLVFDNEQASGKGLEGNSFRSKLFFDNEQASVNQFPTRNLSADCGNIDVSDNVHVSSNGNDLSSESPEYVPKSPPIVVVDQCLPKLPVDGQNEEIELGVSCEVQHLDVSKPDRSSGMEDSQVNRDGVMVMCTDDDTPVKNLGTAAKDDIISSSEDQNVKDIHPQSSSVVDERYSCKVNEVVEHKENANQAQCEGIGEIDTNELRVGNAEGVLNQTCGLNEDSIQMTPPNAEILDKLPVDVAVNGRTGYAHQSTDQGLGKPISGINNRDATWVDLRHECTPNRKPVLNPCSRLKLFRSPGSVSYRRLLPFIMDMEKNVEQRQPLSSAELRPAMNKSNVLLLHTEPGTPTPQSTNVYDSSNIDGSNLTSPEHVTGSKIPSNIQKEMHGQHSTSGDQHCKLETSPESVLSLGQEAELPVAILGPQKTKSPPENVGGRTSCPELPVTSVLHLGTSPDCISSNTVLSDDGKPVEASSLGHNSSEIGATVSSSTQAGAVRKGILKRNPRGCRGLCTCLSCASFRLHAERAFEFSRTQMQDAEEVALDLMTELSRLRKLLAKSAATANDPFVTLNEIKTACKKASEVEDLARNRLGELNYDLNIHCRITCLHKPRVRFANHSEEKVVLKAKRTRD